MLGGRNKVQDGGLLGKDEVRKILKLGRKGEVMASVSVSATCPIHVMAQSLKRRRQGKVHSEEITRLGAP